MDKTGVLVYLYSAPGQLHPEVDRWVDDETNTCDTLTVSALDALTEDSWTTLRLTCMSAVTGASVVTVTTSASQNKQ